MHLLRNSLKALLPLLLAGVLGGCINASTTNPDQPSTTPPPAEPTPDRPGAIPEPEAPTAPGFKSISTGGSHSCAISNIDGTLYCSGDSSEGQLGIDNTSGSGSFREISARNQVWRQVSAGYTHSCAISDYEIFESGGKFTLYHLECWGDNSKGALGYGSTVRNYYQPMTVPDDDWASVSAGNNHSCALRLDHTLWCWGDNANGQLGHDSVKQISPSQVDAGKSWISVHASDQFTCALKEGDTLWCWGLNDQNQFGDGTTTGSATPKQIGSDEWKSISPGQTHVCGIKKSDDTLWCWGGNSHGQIGTGDTQARPLPYQVMAGAITTWAEVAAGHHHTCAISKEDATLWCWGNNETGQLGIGSTSHQSRPVKISHDRGWQQVAAGRGHTCATDKDAVFHCWGLNTRGQLGIGSNININQPRLFDPSPNWHLIDSGHDHSCGLKGETPPYSLWCSGYNHYGQVGTGSTSGQAKLVQLSADTGSDILNGWATLSTGPRHSCAIAINGAAKRLFCWGDNSRGQLGDNVNLGNVPQHWWPGTSTEVMAGATDWQSVSAGPSNSCAIRSDYSLWCWGDNSAGQMGNGVISLPNDPPFPPARITGSWLTVAIGGLPGEGGHVCGIQTDGTLWCWGRNDKSQLGNGAAANLAAPEKIGTDTGWVEVRAGERHTCARKSNGTLWCWGDNSRGQTASPDVPDPTDTTGNRKITPLTVTVPTQELLNHEWLTLDTGSQFTCAIRNNRRLWCWGDNSQTQLTSTVREGESRAPREVQSTPQWQQLALGWNHACGVIEDDNFRNLAYCWGKGAPYQLGDDNAWKSAPQPLPLE